jgi:hypothetical protein
MTKKIGIALLAVLLFSSAAAVFAVDVKAGRYVAGDSRNDLDFDYWILLNPNGTASLHYPDWSANGTWSYDGYEISFKITSATGELASTREQTLIFDHPDTTGTVLIGANDSWWLQ